MYRFLLKPKWIGFHLLCLATIVGMINLAFWQLRRLDEKQTFNARVTSHTDEDIAPLADFIKNAELFNAEDPLDVVYRRVEASGTYLTAPQFEVVNVSQDGTTGRDVVNALRLGDGSLIVVNRGFVAAGLPLPARPAGKVLVFARLKQGQVAGTGQPTDDGAQQLTEIRRVDLRALGQQFDEPLAPMYLELLQSQPSEPAVLRSIAFPELSEGSHLSYTVQWFIFSICVATGWVFAVRRSVADRSGTRNPKKRRGPPPIADEFR